METMRIMRTRVRCRTILSAFEMRRELRWMESELYHYYRAAQILRGVLFNVFYIRTMYFILG